MFRVLLLVVYADGILITIVITRAMLKLLGVLYIIVNLIQRTLDVELVFLFFGLYLAIEVVGVGKGFF